MQTTDDPWRAHYPFESQYFLLQRGHRLHFVDQGHAQRSPHTFVLSHGNPTWSFYYRHLIRALSQNHRVIALDHLGCGLSDKPQSYDYCLAQHSDNLLALMDALELDDVTIIGHDWGGAIGLNAVRKQPQRFQRIVMFNTGAFPPPRVPRRIAVCRTPWLGPLAVRGLNLFARAAQRMAISPSRRLDATERAGMLAPYDSWHNRVAIQRFVDDIPLTQRHRTFAELESLAAFLPTLKLPTLLIWGLQDWCFDEDCLTRFAEFWPHASIVRFADAGHWVVEEKPEEIMVAIAKFHEATCSHLTPSSPQDAAKTENNGTIADSAS